jgi:opacity protein-like surface antigen
MRTSRFSMTIGILTLLLAVGAVTDLHAQERRNWTVTAMGGQFDFDFADDNFGIFALRADRPISKWVRFEAETSLARVDVQSDSEGVFDPLAPGQRSSLATVTLGFQGRYRTRWVEPYAGVAFGLFVRRDDAGSDQDRSVRSSQSTFAVPVGIRIFLTDTIGLRGEVRMRRDQTAFGVSAITNWEKTVGISWTFGG